MWKIKAGTTIQIFAPFGKLAESSAEAHRQHFNPKTGVLYIDNGPWKAYTTTVDKIYEKEEVWDFVAVQNHRGDIPDWAQTNIMEHGKLVICTVNRHGKRCFAMITPDQIQYLD